MLNLNIVIPILSFLACIGPLIFIHEFGHYAAGRFFGVKADVFAIGFGREIGGWTDKRGTRWKIGWLPLGGYVRFKGDMSASSEPSPEWLALPPLERAQTFQAKPLWQRSIIVMAGPVANFLFAILAIIAVFSTIGYPTNPAIVDQVIAGSRADDAGFKKGDRVIAIDDSEIDTYADLITYVRLRPEQNLRFTILRDGQKIDVQTAPATMVQNGNSTRGEKIGVLGVMGKVTASKLPPGQLLMASVDTTGLVIKSTIVGLGQIITGARSAKELGGPIRIAEISGQQANMGLIHFIWMMAMISINLGFINLLPIPMLDGGHLFFYLIESIRRKPLKQEVQEWAFKAGLAALLALMIFVTINDLASFDVWDRLAG